MVGRFLFGRSGILGPQAARTCPKTASETRRLPIIEAMPTDAETLQPDACYLALKARDARFDGCFFTGVTSTGIYCRPVCRVRTPRRENCRFFATRRRPRWPASGPACAAGPSWRRTRRAGRSRMPARPGAAGGAAARRARSMVRRGPSVDSWRRAWASATATCAASSRRSFGVSPLQYLQTRRLLTAKQLLADTDLPMTQVALVSGFASVRRFNAAFAQHYGLNPSALRREGGQGGGSGVAVRLGYRPPYDVQAMLGVLPHPGHRGIEFDGDAGARPHAGHRGRRPGACQAGWWPLRRERHQVLLR
jgi:AraC family transcriptional regulator of adaptative response / DNA-3-methyladenine glycosylase II